MRDNTPQAIALPHAVHVMSKVIKAIDYYDLENEWKAWSYIQNISNFNRVLEGKVQI